jgi:hypothetical protein
MTALTDAYDKARIEGKLAEDEAKKIVTRMNVEQIRNEWISLMGMVAYYSKLERLLYSNPRLHFDKAREILDILRDNPDNWEAIDDLTHLVRLMIGYEQDDQPCSG